MKPVRGVYENVPGSGVWYVRYKIAGKIVKKSIGTRAAAIDEINKVNDIRRTGVGILATSAKEHTQTHEELKAAKDRCHHHELTIALQTGMRKGNQYGLRWDEVDFDHKRINLATTKTGKPQSIRMNSDVFAALQELKVIQAEIESLQDAARKKDGKAQVRMVADGRVFNISENREWWDKALTEAKIKDFRWHDLRHTFATRLMRHTGNIKIVQEACNHANISMTARYAHVAQTDLSAAMEGLATLQA
jgi:integrase